MYLMYMDIIGARLTLMALWSQLEQAATYYAVFG